MPQTIQGRKVDGTYRPVAVDDYGQLSLSSQNPSSIYTLPYDYVAATYPNSTTEVYATYVGGSGGSLQQTVTVVYTDSTKANILNVTRV